ncbi:MAG: hypothetical protein VB106_11140 [Clostridiaceae bacterium]|jgi:hypothetical protein|nr:hypothetical protein [Clostridiaceae bacterium]
MKKIITMVLVGLLILSSSIVAFAEEPNDNLGENLLEAKEFTGEIHQINALRIEGTQLRIQMIEKNDQLIDLFIQTREAGEKEALKAAKEERMKIKEINNEIKSLHEQAAAARKAFREAVRNDDNETAGTEIERLINIHSSVNEKKEAKIEVLDNIIDILS